ncbi:hypothetical protein [uncultured Kordia sp.]|uniref:hypothetical protein n=1 Tax=uncultured Kordia sp. TaxID=507699 RepID=UPI002604225E|nr:hypothetical protein [uncultured Kordia sp.]
MDKKNSIIVLIIVVATVTIALFLHKNYAVHSEEYEALKKFENFLLELDEGVKNIELDSIEFLKE